MENDERDNRDRPPDAPSQQPPADEADEFESASWPAQGTASAREDAADQDRWSDEASRQEAPPPQAEEDLPESEPSVAGQVEARSEMAEAEQAAEGEQRDERAQPAEEAQPAEDEQAAEEEHRNEWAKPSEEAPPPSPPPSEVEAYAAPVAAASSAVPAHSVPATEPGESTQCPRCGTENRPGIAFCRNCGQRLVAAGAPTTVARPAAPEGTQACPRCGTHNRAGVAFCQNCGANLRAAEPGYVPPVVSAEEEAAAREAAAPGHAILGPIVLLVGAIGIATAWLLPFAPGTGSLYDRSFGDPSGYGIAFWTAYGEISGLPAQAYFGFAAPAPILVALLALLAIGGVVRARPAALQLVGLLVAMLWSLGLVVLFVVVEALGQTGGDLLATLAGLSAAGIIFALASLIVLIGVLTRFGRG